MSEFKLEEKENVSLSAWDCQERCLKLALKNGKTKFYNVEGEMDPL